MIEKLERMAMLFDFYGKLLTPKQQEALSLYYEQDLSLGEIADEFGVTRQAVHDIIKRGENVLEEYEEKLGLVKKFALERDRLSKVLNLLDELRDEPAVARKIRSVINEIVEIQQND
ncbi:MAG: YlxM family DNA-binding protein [Bacillota bacterium]